MQQSEIDEISEAFSDAWDEYFGDKMLYLPFDRENTSFNKIYNETKCLKYDESRAVEFNGSLREVEKEDVTQPYGDNEYDLFIITLVTKELLDKGIFEVNHDDIIKYTQRFGTQLVTRTFSIYGSVQKVQFKSTKVFTKIMVKEVLEDREYSSIPREQEEKNNG